MVILKKSRCI